MKLDLIDQKILGLLDENARRNSSELARILGKSKERVNYRIKRLRDLGVIYRPYSFVNSAKLGYTLYRIYLTLRNTTAQHEQEIRTFFLNYPECVFVDQCEGKEELVIMVATQSLSNLRALLQAKKEKFGAFTANKEIHSVFGITRYAHVPGSTNPPFVQEMSLDTVYAEKLDETDFEILRQINTDCRKKLIDIAAKTGITPNATKYRLRRLENDKVVGGYGILVKPSAFEYLPLTVNIRLRDLNTIPLVKEFFRKNARLRFAYDIIGKYDLSLDIFVNNNTHYRDLFKKFKETFSEIYTAYNVSTILERNFNGYLPTPDPPPKP